MMKEQPPEKRLPMTLLQREMIRRLRSAGLYQLAEAARDAWSEGKRAPVNVRTKGNGKDETVTPALREDFDKANEQASRGL